MSATMSPPIRRASARLPGFPGLLSLTLALLRPVGCVDTMAADLQSQQGKLTFVKLRPVVELEEDVYSYEPANNGAGPMWCSGSTCLVRIGDDVFASGLETLKDCKPLNNCRWTLFRREQRLETVASRYTGRASRVRWQVSGWPVVLIRQPDVERKPRNLWRAAQRDSAIRREVSGGAFQRFFRCGTKTRVHRRRLYRAC
jgi:hypothetical protein